MHSIFLPSKAGGSPRPAGETPALPGVAEAVPYEQWPEWAKVVARDRIPQDKGVGDTVRRTIGDAISNAYKKWHKKLFNKACGCERRQTEWNQKYSYKILDGSDSAA